MSDETKSFKTKTGYCYVTPEKIILARQGAVGAAAQAIYGNKIRRSIILYSVGAVFMAGMTYMSHRPGEVVPVIIGGLFSAVFAYMAFNARNLSATPEIDRDKISKVVFKKGRAGLTRSHFVVHFTDENGKQKKRLIIMPGTATGGMAATSQAVKILQNEKLIPGGENLV